MTEQYQSRYYSGQGPVYIGLKDSATGKATGLVFIGDISNAQLTPQVDKTTVIENVSGVGGIGAEFTKKVEYSFSMAMRSIKPAHLEKAIHGINTAKVAGTVTDEAHIAYHDKFISLDNTKVSLIVVTDDTGATTYTEGTDYVAKPDQGMIEILSTGAITDLQPILIDYSYAAQHHISASPNNDDYVLVFTGLNRADGNKQTRCEIYKIKLSPSALGMISDGTQEMPITGTVQLDSTRAAGDQFFSWKTED